MNLLDNGLLLASLPVGYFLVAKLFERPWYQSVSSVWTKQPH